MQLGAGHGFDAQLLTGPPPGSTAEQIIPAGRRPHDVKVTLVKDDAAGEARVRVDSDAEEEAAGPRLLHADQDIFRIRIAFWVQYGDSGPDSLLGVYFKDIESR